MLSAWMRDLRDRCLDPADTPLSARVFLLTPSINSHQPDARHIPIRLIVAELDLDTTPRLHNTSHAHRRSV